MSRTFKRDKFYGHQVPKRFQIFYDDTYIRNWLDKESIDWHGRRLVT